MSTSAPRLYLGTPEAVELSAFPSLLARVLDAVDIACVRLSLASRDEDVLSHAGDALREVTHARDIPLVIDMHYKLARKLGLDGVHLADGARRLREARKELGSDAIVGAFCGTSRHDGMTAGEMGADYVSFGPVVASLLSGDGEVASRELFAWWSEMIEVPVVAEGGLDEATAGELGGCADFLFAGDPIWQHSDGPVAALKAILLAAGRGA